MDFDFNEFVSNGLPDFKDIRPYMQVKEVEPAPSPEVEELKAYIDVKIDKLDKGGNKQFIIGILVSVIIALMPLIKNLIPVIRDQILPMLLQWLK